MIVEWLSCYDRREQQLSALPLLDEWPTSLGAPTQLRQEGQLFWLLYPAAGAIQIDPAKQIILAYPEGDGARETLEMLIWREWLPLIYHICGWAVLHASAVWRCDGNRVIAFSGATGSGKSTLGFGLGLRSGWRQLADDNIGFTVNRDAVELKAVPNTIRLRPASADHFGHDAQASAWLVWPPKPLVLDRVYLIEPHMDLATAAQIVPLKAAEAYTSLLRQAYTHTLELPENNRRLLTEWLKLSGRVAVFRLSYRQSFKYMDDILDAIEAHVRSNR
jgi:hypothetical protein